jgi:hypothetical protein
VYAAPLVCWSYSAWTLAARTCASASLVEVEHDHESVLMPSESIWPSEAASMHVVVTGPIEAAEKSFDL